MRLHMRARLRRKPLRTCAKVAAYRLRSTADWQTYPTATQAQAKLAGIAATNDLTLSNTTVGKRMTTADGKGIGWTNGSLICFVTSDLAEAASNFEDAVPF